MYSSRKILYLSTLCSSRIWDNVYESSKIKPGQAAQKFNRLLAQGLSMHSNECQLKTLSAIPVTHMSHKKWFWKIKSEVFDNIKYNYIPFINLPILKEINLFIYTFFKVFFWSFKKNNLENIVICDILNLSISFGALIACRLTGTKIIAIVMDLPGLIIPALNDKSLKVKFFNFLVKNNLSKYNGYILLTEQMNEIVNPFNRPFIIIEGLVDLNIKTFKDLLTVQTKERILIYAGGIYKRYGVKNLIEGFMLLKIKDIELHIYGSGDLEKCMPKYSEMDKRIKYFGVVNNSIIMKKLAEATLLINPRPTDEEFSKFSFPSKNMEYMGSGTPLVTTKLPGMPIDHYDYVFLFEDESIIGMTDTLRMLLFKSENELRNFGKKSRQFVLNNKSNFIQAQKVLNFLKILEAKYSHA